MLKERAITTASYLFAFSIAFGAGVLSIAMTQLDNFLHKNDDSEDASKNTPKKP